MWLFWLVGVSGIFFSSHTCSRPRRSQRPSAGPPAASSGKSVWRRAYGVAGVIAPALDPGFCLAPIMVFSIFMLGAAVGRSVDDHRARFAPGNAATSLVRHPGAGLLVVLTSPRADDDCGFA